MARRYSPADWISRLKERGFSRKEIGSKIGKSAGYVGKIERGELSGKTVETDLRKAGRSKAKPETTKAVEREQRAALPRQRNTYKRTGSGWVGKTHAGTPLVNALRKAAHDGLSVWLTVTFARAVRYGKRAEAPASVHMYEHGIKASDLLKKMHGDPAQALTDIALSMTQYGKSVITEAEGAGEIEITASTPADQ